MDLRAFMKKARRQAIKALRSITSALINRNFKDFYAGGCQLV
jgi:hypothetical protein